MLKLGLLKKWFEEHEGTVTAFSGGVDSSVVLYVSKLVLGDKGIGIISNSESLKTNDFLGAKEFCDKYDITLNIIKTKEIDDPNYIANPSNRCFFCKNHLYKDMLAIVKKTYPGFTVLNGTNSDDLGDYRPGLEAAKNHLIRSPLAELDINKKEVYEIAKFLNLETAAKPASPCLSSRLPYGSKVTNTKLRQIEKAENILNDIGFKNVRVRHYGEKASIEVPYEQIAALKSKFSSVSHLFQEIGFLKTEIDNEGLVSGKLNRVLDA